MLKIEYDIECASDRQYGNGALVTVYDNGGSTVRCVTQRPHHNGMNADWSIADDNPAFPREFLPMLLAKATELSRKTI